MYLPSPWWLRALMVVLLTVGGIILRFILASRIGGFGLRRFRTHPDEDLTVKVRRRLGDMLFLWAGWVVVQMLVHMKESWLATFWAPLIIVTAVSLSYSSKLYADRYLFREENAPATPALVTWLWVALREAIPLSIILLTILAIRQMGAAVPEEIPVGWSLTERNPIWRDRETALTLLRHRTMLVYLVLFGAEGVYLVIRWALGRKGDIARRMLSRPHWQYFLFRTGWVLLFAGFNLGCISYALEGPIFPYVIPGLLALGLLGILIALGSRPRAISSGNG